MSLEPVAWASAERTLPSEECSGDAFLVRTLGPVTLLAAIDGVGHGAEAAAAAVQAKTVLDSAADAHPLELVRRCHDALHGTRGVAMSVACVDSQHDVLTWVGVGNVVGLLVRPDPAWPEELLLLRPGVVGRHLPPLHAAMVALAPGTMLALATDGIHPGFGSELRAGIALARVAEQILHRHATGADDALVVVARYRGDMP